MSASIDYAGRRAALAARLVEADLDALLVMAPPNVQWLTGFRGSAGAALVVADGTATLATDGRYAEVAAEVAPDVELVVDRTRSWLPHRVRAGKRLGLEGHVLPWDSALAITQELARVEVVSAGRHVEQLRMTKDPVELELLRRACAIACEAFTAMLGWLAAGTTERQAATRLAGEIEARGADGLAFETILASGPNSARPHHRPTDRVLQPADLVKVDFGALVDGYHSDMTRTVALGDPGRRLRAVHAAVRAAQAAGVEAVRAGARASAVDDACRRSLDAAGLGDAFVHGTGHGVGLEIHEAPILAPGAADTLANRMTVTVEPGAYLPGLGGVRVEDVVLVTPNGAERLTTAPTDLLLI